MSSFKDSSIRDYLATDVVAAFNGDPAAYSTDEIILCYPGFFCNHGLQSGT